MNMTRGLIAVLTVTALSGCASQPVEGIKGAFKRAADAITGSSDAETGAATKSDAVRNPATSDPIPTRAPELSAGIDAYENGNYSEAAKILRSALPRLGKTDQVVSRKYLAFIACTSGRKIQCRDEFRQALKLDPAFDLQPAEAGHPVWGPVFRSVKQERRPP
jgi:hypothetical protein